jgi:hypothetical protein
VTMSLRKSFTLGKLEGVSGKSIYISLTFNVRCT